MAYEHKPNSGSLFPNDRKESETHPDKKGSAFIGGVHYWVSQWNGKDGKPDSLKYTPKDAKQKPASKPAPQRSRDLDDEIPF